jgi:DNA-binding transcriptional MerR regulator
LIQRLEYALTGTGLISRLQGTGVTLEQYCQQLERQNHQLLQQQLIKDATLQAVREELAAVRTRELSEAAAAGATEGSAATAVRRLKIMLAKANVTIGGMASKNQQLQNHNDELHHILGDEAPAHGDDATGAAAAAAAAAPDGGEEAGAEAE